jgi:AcrR family transcriptional regulator
MTGMGNRERLLDGAKQCLYEKGFARTTARDIASAAGASLAAIGYHFGTTEELLTQAVYAAVADWGEDLGRALTAGHDEEAPDRRFEAIWTQVIGTFEAHRPLWAVQFELVGQIDRLPEVRAFLAEAQRRGRAELAALFDGATADERVGAFHQALLAGVMTQLLVDPEGAPSAEELTEALRLVTARWQPGR